MASVTLLIDGSPELYDITFKLIKFPQGHWQDLQRHEHNIQNVFRLCIRRRQKVGYIKLFVRHKTEESIHFIIENDNVAWLPILWSVKIE